MKGTQEKELAGDRNQLGLWVREASWGGGGGDARLFGLSERAVGRMMYPTATRRQEHVTKGGGEARRLSWGLLPLRSLLDAPVGHFGRQLDEQTRAPEQSRDTWRSWARSRWGSESE